MRFRGALVATVMAVIATSTGGAAVAATSASASAAAGARVLDSPPAPCGAMAEPFGVTPGASLTATVHRSKDAHPVDYVLWSGTVPSFDGLPLSVDVTVPCAGTEGPKPSVTVLHGFTDDKAVWEETGKSDTVVSKDRPGANSRWNNIWFASRGYVTLTYTARGWHDSCGPDTPGRTASKPAPPRCAGHEYWIHLDDKRWEVRDAQWLTAGLVAGGTADSRRLAITGGSYGGAPTSSAALLADQIMCGGAPVPAPLGADPCRGKADGDLVPWTTADGHTPLTWAAALPLYTFSDLLRVLAPNGRWSDGAVPIPSDESSTKPFGVPLESTVSGLVLAATAFGALAPKGSDPDSDILASTNRLLAGDPYDPADPAVARDIRVYEQYKSPITTEPQGKVPMFLVQGFTDALFPGSEALALIDHLHHGDPHYPVKAFFGDIGHDYAAERQDDWDLVKAQMNRFLDHYLDPTRSPAPPRFDVGASVTRCLPPSAPQTYVSAPTWDDLSDDVVTFTSHHAGTTSTAEAGPDGVATDPISTATLPGPHTYEGCRIVRPATTDPTTATYDFPVHQGLELLGAPVVDVRVTTTGPDVPLAVRVWDVAPRDRAQALVTRGVYRMTMAAPKAPARIRLQLSPQAYRFPAGHHVRVEVTANDSPYLLANNQQADVAVAAIRVDLPVRTAAADRAARAEGDAASTSDGSSPDKVQSPTLVGWLIGLAMFAVVVVGFYGLVSSGRRRRR